MISIAVGSSFANVNRRQFGRVNQRRSAGFPSPLDGLERPSCKFTNPLSYVAFSE